MSLDLDTITETCICGSNLWKIVVSFDDYEIAMYTLTMYCYNCNARAIAPTPLDRPDYA